jgi:hypothetical protein
VDPKFVEAATGNLRLRHDSPLVDAGDPAYNPFLGGLDVVRNTRVRDGDGVGGAVVDLGAREYQRKAPVADGYVTPPTADVGQVISFNGGDSADADGETLTYQWSFDDGATAGGAVAQHAFATPGQHTATLTVTDPAGLSDTATFTVTVVGSGPSQPGAGGTQSTGSLQAGGTSTSTPLTLTGVVLSPRTFRARQLRRARRSARRAPVGTKIRFRLSTAARITFAIDRALPGRKVGRTCRRPSRANHSRQRCVRWVKVGGFARQGKAGLGSVSFDGRLSGKALSAGRYRLRARAQDDQGRRSAPAAPKSFRIAG